MFLSKKVLDLIGTGDDQALYKEFFLLPALNQLKSVTTSIPEALEKLKPIVPSALYNKLYREVAGAVKKANHFLGAIKKDDLIAFLKTAPYACNAWLCGILNSIVDFFKGIFEIIAMILSIGAAGGAYRADKVYYNELTAELFENVITAISKFNFELFFVNAALLPFQTIQKISALYAAVNLSQVTVNVPKVAYLGGYMVGLVTAIVIDAFLTGGVKAVEDITKGLETFLTKPSTTIREAVSSAKEGAIATVETIIELLRTFLQKLKNGGRQLFEDFKKFVEDLVKWLEKVVTGEKSIVPIKIVKGKYSQRDFDINNCGGKILKLTWEDAKITDEGIFIVKKHLSRFEFDEWNERMIQRSEKILNNDIDVTDFDKRFFTHEIRELERYKILGHEETKNDLIPEIWENAHAATLEDYQLYELIEFNGRKVHSLYHPDVQF